MTGREMLELAAKAAGLHLDRNCPNTRYRQKTDILPEWVYWNPLTDDCDALRLAAALKIDLDWQSTKDMPEPTVEAYRSSNDGRPYFCATEPEAGYRRAIVREAAEIGKAMQETTS